MNDDSLAMARYLLAEAREEATERVDLGGCDLTTLPDELFEMTQLTHLSLRNNGLATLPHEIGRLTALTQLSVADNQLTTLPTEIGQLKQLTHLNLKNNQLTALPFEICELEMLEMLQLQGNPLPIPASLLAKWDRPAEIIAYYREHHLTFTEDEPIQVASLHWLIAEQFTEEELEQLCAEICVSYEELEGETHSQKAHALLHFHEQHGLMEEFTFLLRQFRPLGFN